MKFFTKFYRNNLNMPTTKFVTNLFFLKKAKTFVVSQLAHLYITAFTIKRYKLFFIKIRWATVKYFACFVFYTSLFFYILCSFFCFYVF